MRGRRSDAAALAAAALAVAAGCRSPRLSLPDVDGGLRDARVRTVVLLDDVSLYSPFGAEDSARLAGVARTERGRAADALGVDVDAPIPVLLAPAPRGGPPSLVDQVFPGDDGLRGAADRDAAVMIHVAVGTPDAPGPPPFVDREVLRHELVHALLRLAGFELDPWLDEAAATIVAERLPHDEHRLVDDPLPTSLLRAHVLAPHVRLAEVLAWRADAPRAEPASYDLAASFLRFHLERSPPRPLAGTLRDLGGRPRNDLKEDEPAWHAWLSGLDLETRLVRMFQHDVTAVRAEAPSRLLEVADRFGTERLGARFDAVVVDRLLADPRDLSSRAYLLMPRAGELSDAELRRLEASPAPLARVLALALRRRRGEDVPDAAARAAFEALTEDEARYAFRARRILLGR